MSAAPTLADLARAVREAERAVCDAAERQFRDNIADPAVTDVDRTVSAMQDARTALDAASRPEAVAARLRGLANEAERDARPHDRDLPLFALNLDGLRRFAHAIENGSDEERERAIATIRDEAPTWRNDGSPEATLWRAALACLPAEE